MLSKNEVKYIQSLGHKKNRDADNVFIAEGVKTVYELLNADFNIKKIYALEDWIVINPTVKNVIEVNEDELKKISNFETPNKVFALVEKRTPVREPDLKNKISLVLDGIQDPGNMGTIIRTADWFGIRQVICSKDCADAFAPKVIQATMGSMVRVQLLYTDLLELVAGNPTLPLYAASLNGTAITAMPPVKEGAIVIGNESKGIHPALLERCQHHITIPRIGRAESLNAAVAAGIILSRLCMGD